MTINFGALSKAREADTLVDPRDIFNALPTKAQGMNFLRGPQDQVLEKWFQRRDQRDVVVKLNTGGGKTIVGLLIAKSSLAEGKGPVAYLVPDKYLVNQVVAEAGQLGITVVTDPKMIAYPQGSAILVDTFQPHEQQRHVGSHDRWHKVRHRLLDLRRRRQRRRRVAARDGTNDRQRWLCSRLLH